jgi:acyl-CoA synthetase (AMP-forming)/AMP-acid ligase II
LAAILYTSGTTGEPKGALVPKAMAEAGARNLAEVLGEDADRPYGLVVPASHAFGLACLLCGLASGGCAVLVDSTTSLDPLLRALEQHQAPVLHGSPALFGSLLRSARTPPLRCGFTAGSWCPPEVLESFDRRGARLLNLFGMTEIGAAVSPRRDDPPRTRYHTVGQPLPGYEARVADDEIQVRSRYLPSGYHGRPFTEEEFTGDGWFRTGDLGEIDAAGNLMISGRAKEVVHVGGFNVFPAEVEGFLLTHPAIAQSAVVGIPHPVLGEALRAFVVPVAGQPLEARDVIRFARGGIAGYKVPYTVTVVDELPLLPSGKPDRRELAGAAREEALR